MTQRLREHFCCLPYQISHFDRLSELPLLLGLDANENRFQLGAAMDADGHIYFDWTAAKQLAAYITENYSVTEFKNLRAIHIQRLENLQTLVTAADNGPLNRHEISELSHAVASLAPYGLVTKILPDALRGMITRRLAKIGKQLTDESLATMLTPDSTPGIELASALSSAANHSMAKNAVLDPPVPNSKVVENAKVVEQICSQYCGFGPHAWEAPGYETKGFVANMLKTQAHSSEKHSNAGNRTAKQEIIDDTELKALIEHYQYWAKYVDKQATLLRKVFYQNLRPALNRLAGQLMASQLLEKTSEILFCSRAELNAKGRPPPQKIIKRRIARYQINCQSAAYPYIGKSRLDQILSDQPYLSGELERNEDVIPNNTKDCDLASQNLSGLSAAANYSVQGKAHVLLHLDDIFDVVDDAIVVVTLLTPDMAPVLFKIAGIIVEEGSLTQHATLLAREYDIPCIVGVRDATKRLKTGDDISISGSTGKIISHHPQSQPTTA